ncbi:serine/threonine-protein kinase [Saccharopolyspora lacisalsi]|uniref:non-specific serine/threonine protein kinase n=1 Tax=Halosaccharopolyspora lacisalsi TaxID=1000566 RepID=A0A839E5T9_9PSEU|nr:serine/threonine-protein kinase [Halosaccharopolyspora lacisalsi]MBA8826691.1 serine/threonine-protein kinase [Halosaccharopolyspora lacisalsi]
MSEDLTGRRLGHYKIDEVLGRGGMSVMYRATDTRLGRKVALKVMGEHITGDAEFRERFVDEARNTSAIDHPNIVPLYDFGEVDEMLYIAMRLVEGSDLAKLISEGPISPQRAVDLLEQIGEALDLLHERGLVHLDLKPANVLVTSKEASHEHVYLADFGLTRRGATGHRTSSGDFLGSPTYAGPEHLRGEPVDGRTDLYALACMLFACLTGRPPFKGQVQEVIQGHLGGEPPTVTSQVVLPPAIDDVLRKGMAKTPDQRYDDCKELIAAARGALAPALRSGNQPAGAQPGPQAPGPPSGPQLVQPPPPQPQGPSQPGPPQPGPPQPGPPQPPGGYAPQPPMQGPPNTLPPPNSDPVRLRPPMPAQPASFATRKESSARWVVPLLVGSAVILIVVLFIIMGSSIGS